MKKKSKLQVNTYFFNKNLNYLLIMLEKMYNYVIAIKNLNKYDLGSKNLTF